MNNAGYEVHIKKEILVNVIKAFFSDDFEKNIRLIPYRMRPKGMEAPYRCCIYKERAVIKDRIIAGLGFEIEHYDETASLSDYARKALERTEIDSRPLTVLQAACKGCTANSVYVTDLCKGCVARPCQNVCKFGAISMKNGRSVIDNSKCKKCMMCSKVCPYNAIVKITAPCENVCPVDAIKKDETGFANIDFEKCISCGKCVSACPFGAVHEKSQIIDILKTIKSGDKVIAMTAPSIAGQFKGTMHQLRTAIIQAGFFDVYEAAQGADITANNEAAEFKKRILEEGQPFMTTSCCAGYNQLIKKHLNEIKPFVSDTKTPVYYTAEIIKREHPDAKVVFISPCTAKRAEGFENPNIDFVMNFEELEAVFTAKEIAPENCEASEYRHQSSKQGRRFGVTGGVFEAVQKSLQDETAIKPCIINGLNKESIKQLKQAAINSDASEGCNIIEVMCCTGGCIGGNAAINSQKNAVKQIDNFAANSEDIKKID